MGRVHYQKWKPELHVPSVRTMRSRLDSEEEQEVPSRESIKFNSEWQVRNAALLPEHPLTEEEEEEEEEPPPRRRRPKLTVKANGTKSAIARLKREVKMLQSRHKEDVHRAPSVAAQIQKTIRSKQAELAILIVDS